MMTQVPSGGGGKGLQDAGEQAFVRLFQKMPK